MKDLGTLGGAGIYDYNAALGIRAGRRGMGASYAAAGASHAFTTGPNGVGMTDLNSLVNVPGGVVSGGATGINNLGQVAVTAMIPEPKTYAMLLAGLSLLGFIACRHKTA